MAYSLNPFNLWLKTASDAAQRAGQLLRQSQPGTATHAGRDVKLEADRLAENIILETLGNDTAILTEETGWHHSRGALRWIVDPLDGSMNYLRRIPMCCVSIALWEDMKPILGVIYDFNHDELFTGVVGEGAELNGEPIHVSEIQDGVLCTGFPVNTDFSDAGVKEFVAQVQRYKKIRLLGTAALSLAYVAAGRADTYHERDIKIWDVAAGLAIVQAAGGHTTMKSSAIENAFDVYASNRNKNG